MRGLRLADSRSAGPSHPGTPSSPQGKETEWFKRTQIFWQTRDLTCEMNSVGENVMCSRCSGVFKEAYFYKHKKSCLSPQKRVNPLALVLSLVTLTNPKPSTEWDTVMEKMDKDRFFDIIKSDEVIKQIGKHIYDTRKPAKSEDAKIKARTAMRRLAKLVDTTVGISTAAELFVVTNFYQLEDIMLKLKHLTSVHGHISLN